MKCLKCASARGGAQRETNCGNAIAEIGGGEKFVAIVAMPLLKMGGKKNSGC